MDISGCRRVEIDPTLIFALCFLASMSSGSLDPLQLDQVSRVGNWICRFLVEVIGHGLFQSWIVEESPLSGDIQFALPPAPPPDCFAGLIGFSLRLEDSGIL